MIRRLGKTTNNAARSVLVSLLAAACTGCLGAAHSSAVHPPLRVVGNVKNVDDQPVANRNIRLVVAPYTRSDDAVKAAKDSSASSTVAEKDYLLVVDSTTDADGAFRFDAPERRYKHSAAFVGVFVIGGRTKDDVYLVLTEGGADSPMYMARLHRNQLILNRIDNMAYDLMPLANVGGRPEVTGTAERLDREDVVTLTMTVR